MNNTLPGGEILIYKAEDGQVKLEIKLEEETLWLTQQLIAELFQTSVPNINMHIKNKLDCFNEEKKALMQQLLTGKRRVIV